MPTYSIEGPDKKTYSIEGPEGATRDQIIAKIKERKEPEQLTWGGALLQAGPNLPGSALNVAKGMVQPIIHPIETAHNLKNLGQGLLEKAGVSTGTEHKKYVDAVWDEMVKRYGSVENLKRTIANDPAGFATDLATFVAPEAALARVPGVIGKVGEAARTVSNATNPLTILGKGIEKSGDILSAVIGNVTTGAGKKSIEEAFKAGMAGGKDLESFYQNLRDADVNADDLLRKARNSLSEMRKNRSAEYQKGMKQIGADFTPLKFDLIDKAVANAIQIKTFKGQDIAKLAGAKKPTVAGETRLQISNAVESWKRLPPEYHTPAGLDALKQHIGEIRDSLPFNSPERKIASDAYGAVWNTITKQAPQYADVMKGYEQASKQLEEIERTLSLGKKATNETAFKKLLSSMRNNVNTNFGKRSELVEQLDKAGGKGLLPGLAGQALSSWTPHGISKLPAAAELYGGWALNPATLAALPFASPRLMGEATALAGRGVGGVSKLAEKSPVFLRNAAGGISPDFLKKLALASRTVGSTNQQ